HGILLAVALFVDELLTNEVVAARYEHRRRQSVLEAEVEPCELAIVVYVDVVECRRLRVTQPHAPVEALRELVIDVDACIVALREKAVAPGLGVVGEVEIPTRALGALAQAHGQHGRRRGIRDEAAVAKELVLIARYAA